MLLWVLVLVPVLVSVLVPVVAIVMVVVLVLVVAHIKVRQPKHRGIVRMEAFLVNRAFLAPALSSVAPHGARAADQLSWRMGTLRFDSHVVHPSKTLRKCRNKTAAQLPQCLRACAPLSRASVPSCVYCPGEAVSGASIDPAGVGGPMEPAQAPPLRAPGWRFPVIPAPPPQFNLKSQRKAALARHPAFLPPYTFRVIAF